MREIGLSRRSDPSRTRDDYARLTRNHSSQQQHRTPPRRLAALANLYFKSAAQAAESNSYNSEGSIVAYGVHGFRVLGASSTSTCFVAVTFEEDVSDVLWVFFGRSGRELRMAVPASWRLRV